MNDSTPKSLEKQLNTALYTVRTDYGSVFVKHIYKNQDLTVEEIALLINQLQLLHDRMVEDNANQSTIKSDLQKRMVKPLWDECILHYPCSLDYLNWFQTGTTRPKKAKRYCGVYFATHPDMPDLIKIGYSYDVYKRMKALYHTFSKKALTVRAFVETSEPAEIEAYIHRKLDAVRYEGEWFDYYKVIEWVEGLSS